MPLTLLFLPPCDDVGVGGPRTPPRLVALGRLAPRRHRVVTLALALATTHRVVHRVHDGAAHGRAEAAPAHAPGLADRDVLVVEVADLADGGHAVYGDQPDLARGQSQRGAVAFLGEQLRLGSGAAAELGAAARVQLDVVHQRADRDVADGQRVAGHDVGLRARHQHVPHLHTVRGDDVALLAVAVMQQREVRGPVGIVLAPPPPRRDAALGALEVPLPQHALGPAAPVAHGDAPVGVAAVRPALGDEQALL